MRFEEWWKENNCHSDDPVWLVAQRCWDYQQKRIDELEQTLSRMEGIEDEHLGRAD